MSESLLLFSFFLTVLTTVAGAGYWVLNRPEQSGDIAGDTKEAVTHALRSLGERLPHLDAGSTSVASLLGSAGYRWPGAEAIFNGLTYFSSAVLAVVTLIVMASGEGGFAGAIIAAVAAAGLGYMMPKRLLEARVRRRARDISAGLPVAMDLLVLSVEAGQSFDQAILDASRELQIAYPDLGQEFSTMYLSLRASATREQVFKDFAVRVRDRDVAKLSSLLIDSDRFGTSLGPALRSHARFLRIRRRQIAQEAARKIGVKLVFPIFFLIFPSVMLVTLGPAVMQVMASFRAIAGN